MECLESVVKAFRKGFAPFCEEVLRRCISIINQHYVKVHISISYHFYFLLFYFLKKLFSFTQFMMNTPCNCLLMVASLKLLSCVVEVEELKWHVKAFISGSSLMELLLPNLQDVSLKVREAAFNLLYSLCSTCFQFVHPYISKQKIRYLFW